MESGKLVIMGNLDQDVVVQSIMVMSVRILPFTSRRLRTRTFTSVYARRKNLHQGLRPLLST